ncbi:MAG TPA: beta/gamma crystallin-related protein [Kiloniellales bacterium]|nr:beta/gamma crystallin-related protein [Kiloniellales bacterium]
MSLRTRWAGVLAGALSAVLFAVALLATTPPAKAAETSSTIIVYDAANAGGNHATFQAATPSLSGTNFNDRISSVFIVAGSWELCADNNYKGKCVTLTQGLHNLDANLNNLVSSLRPSTGKQGAALLFLDKDGAGKSLRVTAEVRKLADFPGFNSAISSIAIFQGNWEFCRKNDFKGQCVVLGPGVYNLTDFDNVIDSVRPK